MTEEKFLIQMFSGGECKNGQHFMECKCVDQGGKPVLIILPIEGECSHCECCEDLETCGILHAVGIELGRSIIVRRPD